MAKSGAEHWGKEHDVREPPGRGISGRGPGHLWGKGKKGGTRKKKKVHQGGGGEHIGRVAIKVVVLFKGGQRGGKKRKGFTKLSSIKEGGRKLKKMWALTWGPGGVVNLRIRKIV